MTVTEVTATTVPVTTKLPSRNPAPSSGEFTARNSGTGDAVGVRTLITLDTIAESWLVLRSVDQMSNWLLP